jgi:hypothetical protein
VWLRLARGTIVVVVFMSMFMVVIVMVRPSTGLISSSSAGRLRTAGVWFAIGLGVGGGIGGGLVRRLPYSTRFVIDAAD